MTEADAVRRAEEPATVESLAGDLARLGVERGMTLLVHSSLGSLGWVSGAAVALIEALTRALGPSGTLVMPSFTTDLSEPSYWTNPPVPEDWWPVIRASLPPFDPATTPTTRIGVVAETFRTLPGVRRSGHPAVSFAARGPLAEWIVAGHQLDFGLGEGSPLARLYDRGAHVLLLGVRHDRNTSLHLAEHRATYAGRREIEQGAPIVRGGARAWATYRDLDLRSDDFISLGEDFGPRERCGRVACAVSRLFPQRDAVDFAVRWIEAHRVGPPR